MVATPGKLYTIEEFMALPEDMTDGCELIDGRLVKKHIWEDEERTIHPLNLDRALTISRIIRVLGGFVDGHDLGGVLPSVPFLVGANRDRVRRPDVAFVAGPLPTEPDKIRALVPALVIEVISPNDLAGHQLEKLLDYLDAGVPLVWQVFPKSRHVWGCKAGRGPVFRSGDTLNAEPVLPGFACPVDAIFPTQLNQTAMEPKA